jgi:hypothetical protein
VLGLMFAYTLYSVQPQIGKTLNAVLFERIVENWQPSWGQVFVWVTLFSEAALLFIAAQAGFLDGPRVLANMSLDRWFPSRFAMLSDRFVTQNGIMLMGGAALLMMLLTGGSVRFLVVLYSINVFITFVFSQLGMVRHWWRVRETFSHWKKKMAVNALGLLLTAFILISMTVLKFHEGGWITLLVTGAVVGLAILIKRHYQHTSRLLRRLDHIKEAVKSEISRSLPPDGGQPPVLDRQGKTAVLFVNGFNGLGCHTLLNVINLFGATFKNFIFVQIGVIDAGNFKGAAEIERLQSTSKREVEEYVLYVRQHGYYAEGISAIGTDVFDEIEKILPVIRGRFQHIVFFGGQIVFPNDSFLTRVLHNYTVLTMQRKFYSQGIPFVIMPVRVGG